jgi:glycosyltransferase involved in cell wall biosynthesis
MSDLKSAYDLACERIISSPQSKIKTERDEQPLMDFIEIPEFSNREDRVIESRETKLITGDEPNINEKRIETDIKVIPSQCYSFDDKFMEVGWNGHFFDYGGFARMNRTMVFGLSNRNVKVKTEIEPYLTHVNSATQKELRRMANIEISPKAPIVFGVTVPSRVTHSGRKILYTMIETSEKVHPDYAGKLNLMDEIWVATEYGKKILQKSNVHPPIYVMPLGVDTSRYKPIKEKMDFGSSMKGYTFVSVFRWSYRKGFDILLRAYMEEFSEDEDVSLLLVSRVVESPEEKGEEKIVSDFNDIKNTINKGSKGLPHVALYTNTISEKDMPKLYNSADAFVLISRGEGFALPFIEAAACELPVIGSNVSGQTDFLNKDNSFLVEPNGYLEANVGGNMSRMAKLCHFYNGQKFPDFNEDTIRETRRQMRYVFENRDEAKKRAKKLSHHIRCNYTWDMAVDRVYRRLKEIS